MLLERQESLPLCAVEIPGRSHWWVGGLKGWSEILLCKKGGASVGMKPVGRSIYAAALVMLYLHPKAVRTKQRPDQDPR